MSLSLSFVCILQGCVLNAICVFMMMTMMTMMILVRVTLRARIANRLVTDSRLRGGIVNSLSSLSRSCACALVVRLQRSKALWQFRVSTSNSRTRQRERHDRTPFRRIDHIYAQQGIQGYGDDHLELRTMQ